MSVTLVFTVILYGLTFTSEAGKFETYDLCGKAADQLSGPNFVGACRQLNAQTSSGTGSFVLAPGCGTNGTICTYPLR